MKREDFRKMKTPVYDYNNALKELKRLYDLIDNPDTTVTEDELIDAIAKEQEKAKTAVKEIVASADNLVDRTGKIVLPDGTEKDLPSQAIQRTQSKEMPETANT